MDTRTSALVVGTYVAGAVIVLAVAIGYYVYGLSGRHPRPVLELPDESHSDVRARHRALTARYAKEAAAATKPGQSLRELQSSLAATRDMLEKRTVALNQKNAECKALKAELDQSFMVILRLLSDDSEPGDASDLARQAKAKLDSELNQLKGVLGKSDLLDTEREGQLGQLQAELLQADLELSLFQQESKRELDMLAAEKKNLEDATMRVIAGCGMAAVPWLIELLPDERVAVRRWSAKALGAIGADALDAVPVLQELLTDPDGEVRLQAQRAIQSIMGLPVE